MIMCGCVQVTRFLHAFVDTITIGPTTKMTGSQAQKQGPAWNSHRIGTGKEKYHLVGTFTRYSSWTARVEVLLEYYEIPYTASFFHIYKDDGKRQIKQFSPTGKVPCLVTSIPQGDRSTTIHVYESLAISEFLAESHPELPLWPRDRELRALARSAAAEMHAGFESIRESFTSNFLAKYTGPVPISDKDAKDIKRVLELWGNARKRTEKRMRELGEKDEGFLFGKFGIVDAFFWPVLGRFRTYNLPLDSASPEALAWIDKMWNEPVMKRQVQYYFRQAEDPETGVDMYEDVFKHIPEVKCGTIDKP
ncbi:putative glutamine amidotransferase subunit pdxt [Phaeomoniella chlamydospora]|uniref:Putative glutamine amidotransferase subunit pdxt n=1 Tax=Phaeomoniella chlamydospora TaxID=158046 RepID=A0A0G2EZZ2_PHACM|nr:putative glutamine amidotransferase subunit pdxt [Phaeomoniella chlamydospora]